MVVPYRILSGKGKSLPKQERSPRTKTGSRSPKLELLRDENGAVLVPPERMPSGRPFQFLSPSDAGSSFVKADRNAPGSPFNAPSLAWLMTLIHFNGGLRLADAPRSCWVPVNSVTTPAHPPITTARRVPSRGPLSDECHLPWHEGMGQRPWAMASGVPEVRERQAAIYLRLFDHENARLYDAPEFVLLKVVCNLRRYFGMNLEQTASLMTALYNPMSDHRWSREGISLAWELVSGFTPSLGLKDVDGVARQRAVEIEDVVTELLAYTRAGGRVQVDVLWEVLNTWEPDLHASKTELGKAIKAITGIESGSSKGIRYYSGFHLPTPAELQDADHWAGMDQVTLEWLTRPEIWQARRHQAAA